MTWTKLSDDAPDEMWSLSDAAFRLHIELLVYSNRKLLDGRIERDELRRFAKRPEALDELIRGGWVDLDGDVVVVGFQQQWQRSRQQVLALTERNRKNGGKGGRPLKSSNPPGNPPGLPDGNPEAKPSGNPEGQVRTGQALTTQPPTSAHTRASGESTTREPTESRGQHPGDSSSRSVTRDAAPVATPPIAGWPTATPGQPATFPLPPYDGTGPTERESVA